MKKLYLRFNSIILILLSISSANQSFANGNIPKPDHVVIVIMENHSYSNIIGSSSAPHINALASDTDAAVFTQSYGIQHPSQPNYLAFFSGSNQGVTNDNKPTNYPFTTANLAAQLIGASYTFTTYSEGLPSVGYDGATSSAGHYARKHNPAANWVGTGTNQIPSTTNQPFTAFPSSSNYANLPKVCYVVPNLSDDMHDGTVAQGDTWFNTNMQSYVTWAKTHNSLLILTWDEDDLSSSNQILTIFVGPMVKGASYSEHITHYSVLRTIEDMYSLPYAGSASSATTITDIWRSSQTTAVEQTLNESNISVDVFPNPASSSVKFKVSNYSSSNIPELSILDMLGRTKQQLKLEDEPLLEVSTGSFANGLYYYYLTQNGSAVTSGKFIVAH